MLGQHVGFGWAAVLVFWEETQPQSRARRCLSVWLRRSSTEDKLLGASEGSFFLYFYRVNLKPLQTFLQSALEP